MAKRIAPLVVRSRWRARRPKEITPIDARAVRFLVVHYSAMSTTCPGDELAAFVRRLDREYFGKAGGGRGSLAT